MINRIRFFGLSVLLIGCFFVVFGLDLDRATLQRFSGFTMGTSYEIQIITDSNSIDIRTVEENVAGLLRRLDREIFSTYSPTSELTQLNMTPATEVFSASRELIEVLVLSEEIRGLTDGAFDISISPLVNLWGFGAQSERIVSKLPTQLEIDDAMARMGAEYLVINESNLEVVKTKDIQIIDAEVYRDDPSHQRNTVGALYDMSAPSEIASNPAGSWNKYHIMVDHKKNQAVIVLNEIEVNRFKLSGPEWESMKKDSKFANMSSFGKYREGHLTLQDHPGLISYKNIKIRRL